VVGQPVVTQWLMSSGQVDCRNHGQHGEREDRSNRRPAARLGQITQSRTLYIIQTSSVILQLK